RYAARQSATGTGCTADIFSRVNTKIECKSKSLVIIINMSIIIATIAWCFGKAISAVHTKKTSPKIMVKWQWRAIMNKLCGSVKHANRTHPKGLMRDSERRAGNGSAWQHVEVYSYRVAKPETNG